MVDFWQTKIRQFNVTGVRQQHVVRLQVSVSQHQHNNTRTGWNKKTSPDKYSYGVSQESDAKTQTAVMTTYLITILKHPFHQFNYHYHMWMQLSESILSHLSLAGGEDYRKCKSGEKVPWHCQCSCQLKCWKLNCLFSKSSGIKCTITKEQAATWSSHLVHVLLTRMATRHKTYEASNTHFAGFLM